LVLSSCITPYDVVSDFHPALVVEGLITDQPGPYLVTLTMSVPVSGEAQLDDPVPVTGATIVIQDDQGNSETLTEKSTGNYYTSTFQGVIGRAYSITIATGEGDTYHSAPETLLPVGDFTNLRFQFVQDEPPPPITGTQLSAVNGFKIYIDSEVLPEQESRVWWTWAGTFEIFTYPELQLYPVANPPNDPVWVPDAPPCSGYEVEYRRTLRATKIGPLANCTCCTCWVTEYNSTPILSDPKFVSNGMINDFNVGFIAANRRTFYQKYYLEVNQLSVSQTIYNFWKDVLIQKGNSSNLFQTPPPKTVGNITAGNAKSLPAIGYFAASSVKKHAITMMRSDVPYNVGLMDTLAISCDYAYKYSTDKKPGFW
jgi:hypothetical protein